MLRRAARTHTDDENRLGQEKSTIVSELRKIITNEQDLSHWLDQPNEQLGGRSPNGLLGTPEQKLLLQLIQAVKFGLPT